MRGVICSAIGVVGAFIAGMYGGWSSGLTTLVLFMSIDYITGMLVAAVWHKSTKTETGAASSAVGFKGLVRKGVVLLIVLVACRLDIMLGVNYVRDATVVGFCANEALSIIENAALMGLPIPPVLKNAVDLLRKGDKDKDENSKPEELPEDAKEEGDEL